MLAKDVPFAKQVVKFNDENGRYIRINASRDVVARERGIKAFVNLDTGRVLLKPKNEEVWPMESIEDDDGTYRIVKARDVEFGADEVQLSKETDAPIYVRANVSRVILPRSKSKTVFVNVETGRLELVDKDRDVYIAE